MSAKKDHEEAGGVEKAESLPVVIVDEFSVFQPPVELLPAFSLVSLLALYYGDPAVVGSLYGYVIACVVVWWVGD